MLDGRVLEASQVEYKPFGKPPLQREEGPSCEHHRGGHEEVFQALGVPANVYSDDGSEFKREFKELMDFWDIEKQVTRGHAYFAERTIRTIKEAMLRRVAAGAGRRGRQRHLIAQLDWELLGETQCRMELERKNRHLRRRVGGLNEIIDRDRERARSALKRTEFSACGWRSSVGSSHRC